MVYAQKQTYAQIVGNKSNYSQAYANYTQNAKIMAANSIEYQRLTEAEKKRVEELNKKITETETKLKAGQITSPEQIPADVKQYFQIPANYFSQVQEAKEAQEDYSARVKAQKLYDKGISSAWLKLGGRTKAPEYKYLKQLEHQDKIAKMQFRDSVAKFEKENPTERLILNQTKTKVKGVESGALGQSVSLSNYNKAIDNYNKEVVAKFEKENPTEKLLVNNYKVVGVESGALGQSISLSNYNKAIDNYNKAVIVLPKKEQKPIVLNSTVPIDNTYGSSSAFESDRNNNSNINNSLSNKKIQKKPLNFVDKGLTWVGTKSIDIGKTIYKNPMGDTGIKKGSDNSISNIEFKEKLEDFNKKWENKIDKKNNVFLGTEDEYKKYEIESILLKNTKVYDNNFDYYSKKLLPFGVEYVPIVVKGIVVGTAKGLGKAGLYIVDLSATGTQIIYDKISGKTYTKFGEEIPTNKLPENWRNRLEYSFNKAPFKDEDYQMAAITTGTIGIGSTGATGLKLVTTTGKGYATYIGGKTFVNPTSENVGTTLVMSSAFKTPKKTSGLSEYLREIDPKTRQLRTYNPSKYLRRPEWSEQVVSQDTFNKLVQLNKAIDLMKESGSYKPEKYINQIKLKSNKLKIPKEIVNTVLKETARDTSLEIGGSSVTKNKYLSNWASKLLKEKVIDKEMFDKITQSNDIDLLKYNSNKVKDFKLGDKYSEQPKEVRGMLRGLIDKKLQKKYINKNIKESNTYEIPEEIINMRPEYKATINELGKYKGVIYKGSITRAIELANDYKLGKISKSEFESYIKDISPKEVTLPNGKKVMTFKDIDTEVTIKINKKQANKIGEDLAKLIKGHSKIHQKVLVNKPSMRVLDRTKTLQVQEIVGSETIGQRIERMFGRSKTHAYIDKGSRNAKFDLIRITNEAIAKINKKMGYVGNDPRKLNANTVDIGVGSKFERLINEVKKKTDLEMKGKKVGYMQTIKKNLNDALDVENVGKLIKQESYLEKKRLGGDLKSFEGDKIFKYKDTPRNAAIELYLKIQERAMKKEGKILEGQEPIEAGEGMYNLGGENHKVQILEGDIYNLYKEDKGIKKGNRRFANPYKELKQQYQSAIESGDESKALRIRGLIQQVGDSAYYSKTGKGYGIIRRNRPFGKINSYKKARELIEGDIKEQGWLRHFFDKKKYHRLGINRGEYKRLDMLNKENKLFETTEQIADRLSKKENLKRADVNKYLRNYESRIKEVDNIIKEGNINRRRDLIKEEIDRSKLSKEEVLDLYKKGKEEYVNNNTKYYKNYSEQYNSEYPSTPYKTKYKEENYNKYKEKYEENYGGEEYEGYYGEGKYPGKYGDYPGKYTGYTSYTQEKPKYTVYPVKKKEYTKKPMPYLKDKKRTAIAWRPVMRDENGIVIYGDNFASPTEAISEGMIATSESPATKFNIERVRVPINEIKRGREMRGVNSRFTRKGDTYVERFVSSQGKAQRPMSKSWKHFDLTPFVYNYN